MKWLKQVRLLKIELRRKVKKPTAMEQAKHRPGTVEYLLLLIFLVMTVKTVGGRLNNAMAPTTNVLPSPWHWENGHPVMNRGGNDRQ